MPAFGHGKGGSEDYHRRLFPFFFFISTSRLLAKDVLCWSSAFGFHRADDTCLYEKSYPVYWTARMQ